MGQLSLFHKQEEEERRQEKERETREMEKTPPFEFAITLFDGTPVNVIFRMRYFRFTSHFEFHGDMTETGYRSHFPGGVLEGWTETEIQNEALAIANASRKELLETRRKEARKATRKKRAPIPSPEIQL